MIRRALSLLKDSIGLLLKARDDSPFIRGQLVIVDATAVRKQNVDRKFRFHD